MRTVTREANTSLQDSVQDMDEWIQHNPMGIATEREIAVQNKGTGSVYRCLFINQQQEQEQQQQQQQQQQRSGETAEAGETLANTGS